MNTLPARLANVGAECAVLSAAFYREDWRLEILQSLSVEDFTRAETRAVFEVMRNMDLRGEKISVESLTLHDKELADAGFIKGRDLSITDITLAIPNQYDFAGYVESIKEMSARREVFRSAQTAARMIQQGEMSEVAFAELEIGYAKSNHRKANPLCDTPVQIAGTNRKINGIHCTRLYTSRRSRIMRQRFCYTPEYQANTSTPAEKHC